MTYREYMQEHDTENLSWCKPYTAKDGAYALIMYEGKPDSIISPDCEAHRWNGTLTDDVMEHFARAVNPDYDLYSGYDDAYIAIIAMQECGCAACPFCADCDAMGEEFGAADYRG